MPTAAEWAYLAGLFDGEGNVTITVAQRDKRPYHDLRLCITNTDRALLEWAQVRFGGAISVGAPGTKSQRPTLNLRWAHADLVPIVEGMRPYCVGKVGQLGIALAYRATVKRHAPGIKRNHVTPEVERERDRLHRELNMLNGGRAAVFMESFRDRVIPPKGVCVRGHPLVDGNLRAGGRRQCLTCHRERERRRR